MKNLFSWLVLIVSITLLVSSCSEDAAEEFAAAAAATATSDNETTAPVIGVVIAVPTPSSDNTSTYTFFSTEAGTITYGGSCSSSTTSATVLNNTITFNALADGTYSNCTITVTDNVSNVSNVLAITSFVVDTTAPTVAEVTAVTTPTSDFNPSFTFSSNEAGTITYGGTSACSSTTSAANNGYTPVTLGDLRDGTYDNCTVTVTDSAANVSNTLTLTSFLVDTTAPTVAEVTAVTNPTNDPTPNYTFSSNEAGTITYGGSSSCSSDNSSAISGNSLIVINSLRDGSYDNCTVTVTDSAANVSNTLTLTSFNVDSSAARLVEVTPVSNPSSDSTPDYTFNSSEAGAITYGGACSTSTTSATVGNNLITLLATADNGSLANNTYDNCTITVTDTSTNTVTLNISSFVIDATIPWNQQSYIKAENNDSSDIFGGSVSIDGDTLAVSAINEDSSQIIITNGTTADDDNSNSDSGGAYVYKRTGSNWAQEAYIKASNNDAGDNFGTSISIDVDTIGVGATGEDSGTEVIINGMTASSNDNSSASGAVYVYKRYGNFWIQEAYIKAANADGDNDSNFGHSVSVDGDTLAVSAINEDSATIAIINGATAEDNNSASDSGAVYVYKRTGQTWAQEAYIKAVNGDNDSYFGYSVSLDGDTLAVGAYAEDSATAAIINGTTAPDNDSNNEAGAVYVYKRTGSNWAQEAYIKASNNDAGDRFGWSVSIDGDTLVVGAYLESSDQRTITNGAGTASSDDSMSGTGAVYVYKRTGNDWAQEAFIKAANSNVNDNFGRSVSIDGDIIAVGAYLEDSSETAVTNGTTASSNNDKSASGAVYVFTRNGAGIWAQDAYIKASNSEANDSFGDFVSIDAATLAVGAKLEDSNQTTITNGTTTASSNNDNSSSGAIYVYK
jgi:riboflavin synthase alpha subunit